MNTGEVPQLLFCLGPEEWLKKEAIRSLLTQAIAPGFEEVDLVRFPEPPEENRAILEAAYTASFGSPYRVVVVEGLPQIGPETMPWLKQYLARPNPKTCLVVCSKSGEGPLDLPLREGSGPWIQVVWCRPLTGRALEDWVVAQARRLGKGIEPKAIRLLTARRGSDLNALEQTLKALALLAAGGQRITADDVEALVGPSVQETAFDILKTAANGYPSTSIGLLHQALRQGKLTIEHHFLGALGWYYRMVWRDRVAPFRRVSRWSDEKLKRAFQEVLEADTQVKRSHPNPELLADLLLLKLGSWERRERTLLSGTLLSE